MEFLFENDLQELEKLLKVHDWYYQMEDDSRYYTKGLEEEKKINDLIKKLVDSGKRKQAESLWYKYAWKMRSNDKQQYPFPVNEKATSIAQQRLMGMAWAVRQGDLERSKVSDEVLTIADSDMTDKELEKFAKTKHEGLPKHIKENNIHNMNNGMKKRVPSFDEFVSEGLRLIGTRPKTDDDIKSTHKEPIPKNIPAIIKALQPDQIFEDKKGVLFRVMENNNGKIKFVQLLANGKDSDHVRSMPDKLLAQLFVNREYFFTYKDKMRSF